MKRLTVLAILLVAACDTATPGFMGADVSRITVDDMEFAVRVRGSKAEAQRKNFILRARYNAIAPKAGIAMERVSGCKVRPGTLKGDPSIMYAALDCS